MQLNNLCKDYEVIKTCQVTSCKPARHSSLEIMLCDKRVYISLLTNDNYEVPTNSNALIKGYDTYLLGITD